MTDDDFLAEIRANPEDDTERLVYGDWLVQRGDPRGELIHVQCALARRPDPALQARERELLDRHAPEWLGPWYELAHDFVFRRGLLDEVAIPPGDFLAHAAIAARGLLRSITFDWRAGNPERSDDYLAAIASLPAVDTVERVQISNHHVGAGGMRALAQLPRLRDLALDDTDSGDDGIAALVDADGFTALQSLTLRSNRVTDEGAAALAAWPHFTQLAALDLSSIDIYHPTCNDVGDLGALAVAAAAGQLRRLDLGENPAIGDTAVVAMAGLPQLATLRSLTLEFTAIHDRAAIALATSDQLAQLEHLDCGFTSIGDEALPALLAMPALRSLTLSGTSVTLSGLELLLAPSCHLVETELRFNTIEIRGELARRLRDRYPGVDIIDD